MKNCNYCHSATAVLSPLYTHSNQNEISSGKSNTVSLSVNTSLASLGVQKTSTAFKQSPLSTLQSAIIDDKTSLVSEMLKPAREKIVESPSISMIREMTATVGRDSGVTESSSGMYSYMVKYMGMKILFVSIFCVDLSFS